MVVQMCLEVFNLRLKQAGCRHFHVLNTEEFLAVSVLKIKSCETATGKEKKNIETVLIPATDL